MQQGGEQLLVLLWGKLPTRGFAWVSLSVVLNGGVNGGAKLQIPLTLVTCFEMLEEGVRTARTVGCS